MSHTTNDIIIENARFRLTVGSDCVGKSLICKATNEECLQEGVGLPLFTVTQERPFHNEIKLAFPCKRTVYAGNSLRREGDRLIVGFDLVPYDAVVRITEAEDYINFALESFIVHQEKYGFRLSMDLPPVAQFRLLQLPVRNRTYFGDWLNVNWDDHTAVNVLASDPQTLVDAENCGDYRVMFADVRDDIQLKGPGVALIATGTEGLLDCIASVEEDFDLPRGVESRRSSHINSSIYWVWDLSPETVEEHIRNCKACGFSKMLVYYTSMFHESGVYYLEGNYDFKPEYPNGKADLIAVLDKIKAAGILPGLHFLQTHIGLKSRYVTPVADHRLNIKRHFTLAKPLDKADTTIFVEQNPAGTVMTEECRVLQFGGELISYESYSTKRPYCFTGCVRGAHETIVQEHPVGQIGGLLDISEFEGESVYIDQNTSLADEIADKIADIYNCGFRFMYLDGSEGTNVPYAYHIPNAQYRVYQKMNPAPLFAEGAAKAHFSWHMLSGGNAFDIFKAPVFKQMIAEHPAKEAPRMKQDFTRLNFGWWAFWGAETQADMYEYGTSRAAAWDCPVTLLGAVYGQTCRFGENPRMEDIFEVLRRWEEVRATNWLTQEQKKALQDVNQEHILLVNEQKAFELVPYDRIEGAACGDPEVSAFCFERNNENYVVYWHHTGSATMELPLDRMDFSVVEELWASPMELAADGAIPVDKRRYIRSGLPMEVLKDAIQKAKLNR